MITQHGPEFTLAGGQYAIGIGAVSDSIGCSADRDVDSGFLPSRPSREDEHPRWRNGRTFRLVTDGLRISGVDAESVEAAGERIVNGVRAGEYGHILRMDPEPTSTET
ncbi:MAG: hypothetical protein ABEI98_10085 [Halorhabdus sp.]